MNLNVTIYYFLCVVLTVVYVQCLLKKTCSGCIKGSMCYNICNIAPCSLEHGAVDYCFECEDYPCDKYEGIDENDSLMTHINQLIDMEKAKTM